MTNYLAEMVDQMVETLNAANGPPSGDGINSNNTLSNTYTTEPGDSLNADGSAGPDLVKNVLKFTQELSDGVRGASRQAAE